MTEYMYLADVGDSSSLSKVEGYYNEIELKKGNELHVCKIHYNSRLDRIIIVTDYPEASKGHNIEDDLGFIMLCNRACDSMIDYFLEAYMENPKQVLNGRLQRKIDLIKSLQTFLLNGNIIK